MQHKTEQRSSKCEDPIVVSQTEQRDNKREDPIVVSPTEIHSKHNVIMYPDATSSSFQQTEFNNRERPNNIFSESFYEDIREEKVHLVLQNGNALISHIDNDQNEGVSPQSQTSSQRPTIVFGSKYPILNSAYTSFHILHNMLSSSKINRSRIIQTATVVQQTATDDDTLSSSKISSSTIIQTATIMKKTATEDDTLSSSKISSSTIIQTASNVEKTATDDAPIEQPIISQPTNSHVFGTPSLLGMGVFLSTPTSSDTVFGGGKTSPTCTTNFKTLSNAIKRKRKQ